VEKFAFEIKISSLFKIGFRVLVVSSGKIPPTFQQTFGVALKMTKHNDIAFHVILDIYIEFHA